MMERAIETTESIDKEEPMRMLTTDALNHAIEFAVESHAGGTRKGTNKPYIVHPLEVLTILARMNADIPTMIAGVLHDTVEDTEVTTEEIRGKFGDEVAELVAAHSEDKSKTWEERKAAAIEELASASYKHRLVVFADKLANLRDLAADYDKLGDEVFARFNRGKEQQAWYYGGMVDSLKDLKDDRNAARYYRELCELYQEVFGK